MQTASPQDTLDVAKMQSVRMSSAKGFCFEVTSGSKTQVFVSLCITVFIVSLHFVFLIIFKIPVVDLLICFHHFAHFCKILY